MNQKVKGSLTLGLLGDAYGNRFAQSDLPAGEERWAITDAAEYMVATCESILEAGKVDAGEIGARMRKWYMDQQLSGLEGETLAALSNLVDGDHWSHAGSQGDAHGNTGLLRMAPLAFLLDPGREEDRNLIRDVISLTHDSEDAYQAALTFVLSIRLVQNDRHNFIQRILRHLPPSYIHTRLEKIVNSKEDRIRDVGRNYGSGHILSESLPFSIFAAQQAPLLGLQTMMNEIVGAGGDTGGNCSLAGYIAGAHLGTEVIPEEWMEKLQQIEGFGEKQAIIREFSTFVQAQSGIQTLF